MDDVDPVPPRNRSGVVADKLAHVWNKLLDSGTQQKISSLRVLVNAFGLEFAAIGLAILIKDCVLK